MKMLRFTGLTSRDVLRKVRDQLGEGALILSNRAIPGGIEIIAASGMHLDALIDNRNDAPKSNERIPVAPAPIHEAIAVPGPAALHSALPALRDASSQTTTQSALARLRSRFTAALQPAASSTFAVGPVAGRMVQTRVDDEVSLDAPAEPSNAAVAPLLASTAQFIAQRAAAETAAVAQETAPPVARSALRDASRPPPTLMAERTQAPTHAESALEQKTRQRMISAPSPAPEKPADELVRMEDAMARSSASQDGTDSRYSAIQAGFKAETEAMTRRMVGEIEALKSTLHDVMSSFAMLGVKLGDPVRARLFQAMLNAGFSVQFVRYMLENMPPHNVFDSALGFVQRAIEKNLAVVANDSSLLDQGGVFALMGPTGVGKTTTTAKLAARFVLRHGASRVALLSTDSYRIGGHEQLRIYGKILGVTVHAVKDAQDLSLALGDLREKRVVLIDTIGMSQRDRAVPEQMAMLHAVGPSIKRLLLLNATSNGKTLDEVVNAYRDASLAGCILTKIDEATSVGHALDVMIRHRLPLHYVSYGQRVPEDIAAPNKKMLVHRTFRIGAGQASFALDSDESMLVAQGVASRREPGLAALDFA